MLAITNSVYNIVTLLPLPLKCIQVEYAKLYYLSKSDVFGPPLEVLSNCVHILNLGGLYMKSQIKNISILFVSTLLVTTYQNCSQIDSLQSSKGKSLVSYKNVVESSPHVVVSESESQAASQAPVSPIGHPTDLNPNPRSLVTSSSLQAQSEIQRQRDVRAGYIDASGNPLPPAPPTASGPTCVCDQYEHGIGEINLAAGTGVNPDVIQNIMNISSSHICSTSVGNVITGTITYFKCSGVGFANNVYTPNERLYGYMAPRGCEDGGRGIQIEEILSCRHQADTEEPYGVLSDDEWSVYATNLGLDPQTGLPDNNPLPAPTCRDHYNLYWALALGTGENPTYFPNVSFDCRRIYFAAATGGESCYNDLINMAGGAQNTNPQGAEYCPIPEHFNCQASASGCSN